jgi:hypothetical protein
MSRRTSRNAPDGAALFAEFRRTINTTPAQIRAWHASPLSKLASFPHIRAELPLLAKMKETPIGQWTPRMWSKAKRALSFVKRHEAQMRVQGRRFGTGRMHVTEKRVVALLNWGRLTPGVSAARSYLREAQ